MSPQKRPSVVLVGPPGAGKTTVGRALARRMGLPFTDIDAIIVERAGKSIADLFTDDGEDVFRELERTVVAESLGSTDGVLALGGGSVLAAVTRERLRGHRVVYLTVGLADGIRRTGMSGVRPLLAGVNPRATFKALLDARAPLYREVAAYEIDTSRLSANQVVRAVLVALGVPSVDPSDPDDLRDDDTPHDETPHDKTPHDEPLLPSPTFGRPPPERDNHTRDNHTRDDSGGDNSDTDDTAVVARDR